MMTLNQIKALLRDRRLDVVSDATGLHRNTLAYIRDSEGANPTEKTLAALSGYFEGNP